MKSRRCKVFVCALCIAATGVLALVCLGAGQSAQDVADEILRSAGVSGGLVVHLGCGEGKVTAALRASEAFVVHGLDGDRENVARAREYIRARGLYGKVSVMHWAGGRLPYADNLASLVVVEDPGAVSPREVMRVLRPGGVACVLQGGKWRKITKPWPREMDEWTHFRYSAEGNMVSHDELVGPPRHVQWASEPYFQRHHGILPSITCIVASGGRIFYIIDESPLGLAGMPDKWRLVARDAFSGILLWKRKMHNWGSRAWSYWTEGHAARFNHPLHVRKRLVAVGDRVYVTLGFNEPISVLDAATGKTLRVLSDTRYADEFVVYDGVLYAAVNNEPQRPWPGKGLDPSPPANPPAPSKKYVCAVDPSSGKLLWKAGPFVGCSAKPDRLGSMRHINLTVGEKGVFLVDEREIVALQRMSGEEKWRLARADLEQLSERANTQSWARIYHNLVSANLHTIVYHRDTLYVMYPALWVVQAIDPDRGKEIWRSEVGPSISYLDWPDMFGIGDSIWVSNRKNRRLVALDAKTGKVLQSLSIEKVLNVVHHHRCYPNRATVNYALLGRRGAEFVDLKTGEITLNHWARGGCRVGHVLANGLVYRPPDHCRCYMAFEPRGFLALASEKAASNFAEFVDGKTPLEKGPAYGAVAVAAEDAAEDWPTFRHDPLRSSVAGCEIARKLGIAWQADIGGGLTSPVVGGGMLLVCAKQRHEVLALDAATGRKLWSFVADGPVDSPPTIAGGYAVFGSHDGWVYCLRAADGKLAWRLRAAPGERLIVAFGSVESAWPVAGSVLVCGGRAYFVAGRSSLLDGGVYAYAVDLATGRVLERVRLHEVQTETLRTGKLPRGALGDILSTNGQSVFLHNRALPFAQPVRGAWPSELAAMQPHVAAEGGFLDNFWFHRASWRLTSARGQAVGNLICFDSERAYVAAANKPGPNNWTFHVPAGGWLDRMIGRGMGTKRDWWLEEPNLQYGGCLLFAQESSTPSRPRRRGPAKVRALWHIDKLPIMPWAMVSDGKTLFVAGPPDKVIPGDPWAAFEGRAGAKLYAIDAATGEIAATYDLPAPPVWNGMAAARGRLYLSTVGGALICLGQ